MLGAPSDSVGKSQPADTTDRQLVDLVLAGDRDAFECIFRRHKRHVAMVAGRYFEKEQDIEDAIQSTFIRAYQELKSFRGDHEYSLVSWLGRIAATTCLNSLRNRARKLECQLPEMFEIAASSLTDNLAQASVEDLISQRDLLERLFYPLGLEDRILLQMLYAEEMTVTEIAAVFGWSRAKVKIRAFRARRTLRKLLNKLL